VWKGAPTGPTAETGDSDARLRHQQGEIIAAVLGSTQDDEGAREEIIFYVVTLEGLSESFPGSPSRSLG
jgi:hypothetical protein